MKLRTEDLEVGDVFYFNYERYGKTFPCEVVDTPIMYDVYLQPVKVVIIDYWVDEKRHEQIKLPALAEFDVIYRRNTEYKTVKQELQELENESKTQETE